jgi:hypothetical protein
MQRELFLVGKPEGKRQLIRHIRWWEDNVKMDLREIEWGVWTGLIWLRTETSAWPLLTWQWTLRFHKMLLNSWVAEGLVASHEGLSSRVVSLVSYGRYVEVELFLAYAWSYIAIFKRWGIFLKWTLNFDLMADAKQWTIGYLAPFSFALVSSQQLASHMYSQQCHLPGYRGSPDLLRNPVPTARIWSSVFDSVSCQREMLRG